jgi:hypothetical protein
MLESIPGQVKPKTIKLEFAASPMRLQQKQVRAKTGLFGISIMCPDAASCLPAELALKISY